VTDVLVIGEALVDIVSAGGQEPAEHVGGSPANVALGLARLGHDTRLLTRVGRDPRGERIARHLAASGVRLEPGSVTDDATSTATAHLDAARVATYAFDLDWSLPPGIDVGTPTAVHTGSVAATLDPGAQDVLRLVRGLAGRSVVSYDPNARPALMGTPAQALARVEEVVRHCDVVKVSDEDLAWLLPDTAPSDVARRWLDLGPALVVVTRGPLGALGVLPTGEVTVPAPPIDLADTVGAGDALMSGLLDGLATAGLLRPDRIAALRTADPGSLTDLLAHAVAVAAYTCTRPGADPPTPAQLAAWLG
jgi:fructokinase